MQLVHTWSVMNMKVRPSYSRSFYWWDMGQSLWTTAEMPIKRVVLSWVTVKSNSLAYCNHCESYADHWKWLGWCYHKPYHFPKTYRYCEYYCTFLQEVLGRRWWHFLNNPPIILHDNARMHAAGAVTDLLYCWGWEVLYHTPYSPDLSP